MRHVSNLIVLTFLAYTAFHTLTGFLPEPLPTVQEPIMIYSTEAQHDLKRIVTQALREAKHSITLAIYTLSDPDITSLLCQKARDGLDIFIHADPKGIKVPLDPHITLRQTPQKGLMHQKILVIDHDLTLIASCNFTKESLLYQKNLITAIRDHDVATHAKHLITTTPTTTTTTPTTFLFPKQTLELWTTPHPQAQARFEQMLQKAKKTIHIAMYTLTHPQIAHHLIQKHQENIAIHIVQDKTQSRHTNKALTHTLKTHQIHVQTDQSPHLLHHKFTLIDDKTLISGSLNLTRAAFRHNQEVFFILTPLTTKQQKLLNHTWKHITHRALSCV